MTEEEFNKLPSAAIYRRAGIFPEKVMMHPELGDCLTETAVRKLAARAPDQDKAEGFIDWVDNEVLPQIKREGP